MINELQVLSASVSKVSTAFWSPYETRAGPKPCRNSSVAPADVVSDLVLNLVQLNQSVQFFLKFFFFRCIIKKFPASS